MSAITDVQLISVFRKIEKIVKETEVYSKKVDLLRETGGALNSSGNSSVFEDDDEYIGCEMYAKALKVYMESKSYIESLDKSMNKFVDKIGRHEKASNITKNIANNNNNNNNNNNGNNNKESTSSSSDDDSGETEPRRNLKRKSKEPSSSNNGTPTSSNSSGSSNGNNPYANNSATAQKTKRIKPPPAEPIPKEDSPPTSSKADSKQDKDTSSKEQQITNGTLVAAREKSNNSVNWILAKVNGFNQKNQKYEVIDEDEDEPKRFFVIAKDIIQLPSTSSVSNNFSSGTKVLAMFPDTTAFYPAVVVSSTKVKNKTTHYTLHFDDDQGDNGQTPSRRVSAQYVVSFSK
ncbi:DUF1325 family protein [Cavenderia fasciculata]|uniref:DUF1325 family protein n=1 Tax=Cavenderia fasciculata TaxID=261658 RepID=F4Q7B2_CACFS|nr:DUF1325 family protein [Cavenderia fasciculata]EGG16294.1 DUF1325 family protein [Cavenderia fasciculata]|eukprot:XP_004354678.1 DUF1325 family protein [Cavenderia fasciculata]